MPIYEAACPSRECPQFGRRVEHYYPHADSPLLPCEACGGPTVKLISRAALVWLKPLVDYDDPKRESFRRDQERGGHVVYRKRSHGGTETEPVKEVIRTRREQLDYVRDEGLIDPALVGNIEVHADGEKCSSQGLPGSWV